MLIALNWSEKAENTNWVMVVLVFVCSSTWTSLLNVLQIIFISFTHYFSRKSIQCDLKTFPQFFQFELNLKSTVLVLLRGWSPSFWSASTVSTSTTLLPTSLSLQARRRQSPGRRSSTSSTSCSVRPWPWTLATFWCSCSNPRLRHSASLIRGNRSNCALFCDNLDWLVSKLDRLEASSGVCSLFCLRCISGLFVLRVS